MTFLEAAAFVLLQASDAQITAENMRRLHAHESNPIARVFVTHGNAATWGYFAGTTAGTLYVVHRVDRHHPRVGRALLWAGIGLEAYTTAYSWRNKRR